MARMKEGEAVGGEHEEGDAGRGRSCNDFPHCFLRAVSAFKCNWRRGENHWEKARHETRHLGDSGRFFFY